LQLSFQCGVPENSVFPESRYERALEKRFGLESQAGAPRVSGVLPKLADRQEGRGMRQPA